MRTLFANLRSAVASAAGAAVPQHFNLQVVERLTIRKAAEHRYTPVPGSSHRSSWPVISLCRKSIRRTLFRVPSQPGSMTRNSLPASTHGIARSLARRVAYYESAKASRSSAISMPSFSTTILGC